MTMGTPHFMAPEQVSGISEADNRTDIYALATVLFEVLTGRVPFDARNYPQLMTKIAGDPVPSVTELRADVPGALEEVIHKALSKNPEDRYGNMAEFGEALSEFAGRSAEPMLTRKGIAFAETEDAAFLAETEADRSLLARLGEGKRPALYMALGALVVVLAAAATASTWMGGPRGPGSGKSEKAAAAAIPVADDPVAEEAGEPTAAEGAETGAGESAGGDEEAPPEPAEGDPAADAEGAKAEDEAAVGEETADEPRKPGRRKPRAATRRVSLRSEHRSTVEVTLRCGSVSRRVRVPALSAKTAAVPPGECRVSCAGLGQPSCPLVLGAGARSIKIR
jgi:serine/threonine-protein kinase